MHFGDKLREVRKGRNMTQKELAKLLDKTGATVCDWEKGKAQPSLEELVRLADIFQVTTDYLLGRIDSYVPFSELVDSWTSQKPHIRNVTLIKKFSPHNFQLLEDLIHHMNTHRDDLLSRLFRSVGYRLDTIPVTLEEWEEPVFELTEERAFRLRQEEQAEYMRKMTRRSAERTR